ncbi:MAG: flagellar motor switch protein FliM [Candidatus Latescibacterota bacterium]
MAEILSQEEIDALLSAVSFGEEVQVQAEPTRSEKVINTYDFRHPARVSKDQLRTLQNLHDNFARLLSATFSTLQRAIIEINLVSVDQITYSEFIMSLSSPSCTYTFRVDPLDGIAIIDFSQSVVFSFVDRLFGGRGTSIVTEREITWIEKSVMNNIINRTLRDLERTWERIIPLECNVEMLETNPEFVQVVPASETVVLISFELKSENVSGLINLCYPYISIEPIALRLGGQNLVSSAKEVPREELMKNRQRIKLFKAMIRACLGNAEVTVQDLMNLKTNDIITLHTRLKDDIEIYIEDELKFYGKAGLSGKNRAVQITSRIYQGLDEEETHGGGKR